MFSLSGTTRSKEDIFHGLLLLFIETVLKCKDMSTIARKVNQNTPRKILLTCNQDNSKVQKQN